MYEPTTTNHTNNKNAPTEALPPRSPPIPCQRLTHPPPQPHAQHSWRSDYESSSTTHETIPHQMTSIACTNSSQASASPTTEAQTDHIAPAYALTPLSHRAPPTQAELRQARRVRVTPKSPPADGYVWVRFARPPSMHRCGSPTHPACAHAQVDCQFYGFWIAKDKAERYQPRHTQVQQVTA